MCLYADDNKIACTPKNFKIGKSEWFNFKVIIVFDLKKKVNSWSS